MATVIAIALVMAVVVGIVVGAYLKICRSICREDRVKGSLRLDAPSNSTRAARTLVGMSSSRWDD
jgi:hypothetical protein